MADAPKRPHRVDYLSSRSQNEYLELLAKDVSTRVIAEICQAEMFAIIADTTPDVSHMDQLSVVARYVDQERHAQERLVDMREIQDKTGEGHATGILAALDENGLSSANVVFQSYDYTSSMSGVFKGCQAKIKEHIGREVPYFPCLAHRVNTTVEHSCEASTAACHMFEILQELFVFFTSSPKRYSVFRDKVSKGDVENALDLTNLSATRWVARADSIRAVWSSYEEIVDALKELENVQDTKTKTKAKNLLARLCSFEFLIMVMFMRNIMVKTKILTKQLQTVDINIVDTLEAVKATIATLRHLGNDEDNLNKQIDAAIIFGGRLGIDAVEEYQRHHRPRRQPRRIDEQPETVARLDLNEYYRKEFIQILDYQINALSDNVKVALDIIAPCISLLLPPYKEDPKRENMVSLTKLFPLSLQSDVDAVNVELTMFRQHCYDNMPDIKTVEDAARCVKEMQNIFPLTNRCFQLLLTAPITSASSERSFSKLKLIKTAIRSVMKERRLKDVITLGCEKDLTDTIDLETVVDRLAKQPKTQRLIRVM